MFETNADIYKWVEELAQQLEQSSEWQWSEKIRAALIGATGGEVLSVILGTISEIRATPVLRKLGREAEADELVRALHRSLGLNKTSYYIECSWMRQEDTDSWTQRIVSSLNGLAKCDPSFVEGRFLGKKMPLYVAPLTPQVIRPLLEVPSPEIVRRFGYQFSFFFDFRRRERLPWTLTFGMPRGPRAPRSQCALELPQQGEALNPLVRLEPMVCIVKALITSLDPDRAIVRPVELSRSAVSGRTPAAGNLPAWMFYLAGRVGNVPQNPWAYSRMDLEKGILLVLTERPVSRDQPAAIAEARAALRAVGKEELDVQ